MLIDVHVSLDGELQVECAVPREQLEHVIEEADAGRHLIAPLAFDPERQPDRRLARLPIDYRAAHSTSSSAAMARRVSSTMPAVTRMQFSHPGSAERSRTRTPRAAR